MPSHKLTFAVRLTTVILALAASWPFTRTLLATSLVSRADLYLVSGQSHIALSYLKRAAFIEPNNPDLLWSKSLAYVGAPLNTLGPVRDELRLKANTQPNNGELWRDLAIMDTRRKHYADARYEIHMATKTMHDAATRNLERVLDDRH